MKGRRFSRRSFLTSTNGTRGAGSDKAEPRPFPWEDRAVYLTDLRQCQPGEALEGESATWTTIPFTAGKLSGHLLVGKPLNRNAAELSLPLGVKGWHAAYLGFGPQELLNQGRGKSPWSQTGGVDPHETVRVKLTGDISFRVVSNELSLRRLKPSEQQTAVYEALWRLEDLTGKALHIQNIWRKSSTLSFIKLVPLTAEEIAAEQEQRASAQTRRLLITDDSAVAVRRMRMATKAELFQQLEPYRHSDVGKVVWETEGIGPVYYPSKHVELSGEHVKRFPALIDRWHTESISSLRDHGIHLLQAVIEHCHEMGIEAHIGTRPQLIVEGPPTEEVRTGRFFLEHPEFHCRDQEGNRIPRISYAFPEVRQYLWNLMDEWFDWGADGACLLFNRGCPLMLYDEPIVKNFQTKYGRDPRRLGEDDPLWIKHRMKWVTEFLRQTREFIDRKGMKLGRRLQFSAYVLGPRECNEFQGFDIPTLAREVFDFICARGDCFLPGMPASEWEKKWWRLDKVFLSEAVRGTRCKLYFDLMPRQMPPAEYVRKAREFYAAGADGLSMWDSYDRHPWINMWQTVRRLGHKDDLHMVSELRLL